MKIFNFKIRICAHYFLVAIFSILFCGNVHGSPTKDECTFIRDLITAVPDSGGEVTIPAGSYTCNSPIVLDKNNLRLRGQGEVTLKLGKNINAPVIVMGDIITPPKPLMGIEVRNLKIDGNRLQQRMECWGGPCDSGGTSFIRNNGITVRAVTKGKIQDVFITSARSGGVVTEKLCYDLEVENLTAVDNQFDGFAGYETTGAKLNNMNLNKNLAAGISIDIRFHGNIIRNSKIDRNGDVGIFMRYSNSNLFENVEISNSGNHGIYLAETEESGTCPINNEFFNLKVSKSNGFGFHLNNSCEGNRLSGRAAFIQNRDGCIFRGGQAKLKIDGQLICEN